MLLGIVLIFKAILMLFLAFIIEPLLYMIDNVMSGYFDHCCTCYSNNSHKHYNFGKKLKRYREKNKSTKNN